MDQIERPRLRQQKGVEIKEGEEEGTRRKVRKGERGEMREKKGENEEKEEWIKGEWGVGGGVRRSGGGRWRGENEWERGEFVGRD